MIFKSIYFSCKHVLQFIRFVIIIELNDTKLSNNLKLLGSHFSLLFFLEYDGCQHNQSFLSLVKVLPFEIILLFVLYLL